MDSIERASEEIRDILSFLNFDLFKLKLLCEESKLIKTLGAFELTIHEVHDKEGLTSNFSDDDKKIIKKQSLNHLIIITGISLFEKMCKDWYRCGSFYNSVKIKIKDARFLDAERCNKYFKSFNVEIFQDRYEIELFDLQVAMRHAIAHNSGFIDEKFVNKSNHGSNDIGKLIFLSDRDMEIFYEFLYGVLVRMSNDMKTVILLDLKG